MHTPHEFPGPASRRGWNGRSRVVLGRYRDTRREGIRMSIVGILVVILLVLVVFWLFRRVA